MFDVYLPAGILAITLVLALQGCGHKGPLMLPTAPVPASPAPVTLVPASSVPATQPSPAGQKAGTPAAQPAGQP